MGDPAPTGRVFGWTVLLLMVVTTGSQCPSGSPDSIGTFNLGTIVSHPGTVSLSPDAGTAGTCLVALWVDSTTVFEEHADAVTGLTAYTSEYGVGTHKVALYLSNNASVSYSVATIEVDEPLVGFDDTNVIDVLLDGITYVYLGLTNGTRFCLFIDWEDDMVENHCVDGMDTMAPLGHVYDTVGSYTVTLFISNIHNSFSLSKLTWVETLVQNLAIFEWPIPYPAVTKGMVNVTLKAVDDPTPIPSNVNCTFIDTATGEEIAVESPDFYSSLEQKMSVPFFTYGYFRIQINCSNTVSSQDDLFFEIEVAENISGIELTHNGTQWPYVPFGLPLGYIVKWTNGSNMTTDIDFGDGNTDTRRPPTEAPDSWTTPITFEHTYQMSGSLPAVKTIEVTSINRLNPTNPPERFDVTVISAITNLIIEQTSTVSPPQVEYNLVTEHSGPPGLYEVSYDYSDQEGISGLTSTNAAEFAFSHTFSTMGPVTVNVTAWNNVSAMWFVAHTEVRAPITGFSVSTGSSLPWNVAIPVPVGSPHQFAVLIEGGTNITIDIYCHFTGVRNVKDVYTFAENSQETPVSCNYSTPGVRTILSEVWNNVTHPILNGIFDVEVMYPVTDVILSATTLSSSGIITVDLTLPPPNYPTRVNGIIDLFGNGSAQDLTATEVLQLESGGSVLKDFTYPWGTFTLNCTVYNPISTITKLQEVLVVQEMTTVIVSVASGATVIPALLPASLEVNISVGTHLTLVVSFDDGSEVTLTPEEVPLSPIHPVSHTYSTAGTYSVTAEASNPLNQSISASLEVTAVWPLIEDAINLNHPSTVGIQSGLATLSISIDDAITTPGQRPDPVSIQVTFPAWMNYVILPPTEKTGWPKEVSIDYRIPNNAGIFGGFGPKEVSVTLDNNATAVTKNLTFILSEEIEGEAVDGVDYILKDGEMTFTINFTAGWDVSLDIDFGDGADLSMVNQSPGSTKPSHVYSAAGLYTMTCVLSNDVSNRTVTHIVDVREPLDLTLIAKPNLKTTEDLNLTFALPVGQLTAAVSFDIQFGDGSRSVINDIMIEGKYEVLHTYASSGSFYVSVTANNNVSQWNITEFVNVDIPVRGLNFTFFSKVNDTEDGIGIVYEPDEPILITGIITSGTRVNYTYQIGSLATIEGGPNLNFTFHDSGIFMVTLTATNYGGSWNVSMTITIASPVGLEEYTQPPKVYLVDNLSINITMDFPKTLCFHFVYEKSPTTKLILWYENKEGFCSTRVPDYDMSPVRRIENETNFHLTPLFRSPGYYQETLYIYTELKSQKKAFEIFVQRYACEPASVNTASKSGKFFEDPRVWFMSEYLDVTSEDMEASTNCRETSFFTTRWTVYTLSPEGQYETQIAKSGLETSLSLYMFAEGRVLPPGNYCVEFMVLMLEFEVFNGTDRLYLEINPSPLHAEISPDALWQHGNVRPLVMDASETFDPDTNDNTGIIYEWFCRRSDEVLEVTLDPANDAMNVVPVPAVGATITSTNGGCFGDGPGKLDVTRASFDYDPAQMEIGKYIFTVRASKPPRSMLAHQELSIVDGDPLQILIKRDTTVQCPDHYNAAGKLQFYSKCLNCEGLTPIFDWVVLDPNGDPVDLGPSKTVEPFMGGKESTLILTAPPLLPGTDYMLQLRSQVDEQQYIDGLSQVLLRTSSPPVNGSCTITPRSGVFLEATFHVVCEGWKDDDIAPGRSDPLVLSITATVGDKTSDVVFEVAYLPLGDPSTNYSVSVNIYVTDPCGSQAIVTEIVYVVPADAGDLTQEEYALDMLKSIDKEGMRLRSSTIATAALAIAESFDLDDPKNTELQSELVDVLGKLLLVGENYPGPALLAMTDAVNKLSSTLTVDASDAAVDGMFNIMNSLSHDLGQQRSVADVNHMTKGLSGTTASCLGVKEKREEVLTTTADPNAPPSELEEASPEVQKEVEAKKRAKEKEKLLQVQNVYNAIAVAALSGAILQGHDVELGTENFTIGLTMTTMDAISQTKIKTSEMAAAPVTIETNATCHSLSFRSSFVRGNMFGYSETAKNVSGRVSALRMYCTPPQSGGRRRRRAVSEGEMVPVDVRGLIYIDLKMGVDDRLEVNMNESVIDVNTSMIYFTLPIEDDTLGFVLDFEPIPDLYHGQTVQVFIILKAKEEYLYKPKQTFYDIKAELPRNTTLNPWSVVITEKIEKVPLAYIGVLHVNATYNASSSGEGAQRKKRNTPGNSTNSENVIVPESMILKNSSEFAFRVFASLATCRSWDSVKEEWVLAVCSLANESTTTVVRCACTESTERMNSISPGFSPPGINTIDFSRVFGNFAALLAENAAVFCIVIITIVLWLLLLVWARHADVGDIKKWTTQPLIDNKPRDQYLYHITVVTGLRRASNTKSNVAFIISGESADTGIRILDDQYHKGFGRGTSRGFLMATSGPLGDLTYFRVWHDNSGEWSNKSWYLDKVIVEDIQTRQTNYFMCDRWLAVEEDDGAIERVLPVAGAEQILDTKNLFFTSSRRKLADEHLWVSVFARPERNSFTRAQRLTAGVTLLFITMVSNAMWYRTPEQTTEDTQVRIGPITLSLDILYISVMSSLTSIPISTIIILFFSKARPRPSKPGQPRTGLEPPICMDKPKEKLSRGEALEVKKYRRKYPLPWWFSVIGWVLSVLTILAAGFFVMLYSLDWGKVKAEGWLSAFFLCFFENIFIIQPFKVVALALLLSCIFKKLDEDGNKSGPVSIEEKEEEEHKVAEAAPTEQKKYVPLKKSELVKARYVGLRDKLMWQTITELAFHAVFLILVMYLAWGSRDHSDFYMRRSMLGMLKSQAVGDYMSIEKVNDGHKMWAWLRETLIPNLYWQRYYNGQPTPRWARVYLNDRSAVRLGTVRLRQLRVHPDDCAKHIPSLYCRPDYGLFAQEDRDWGPGWDKPANANRSFSRLEKAFTYQSFIDLQNIPYFGVVNVYGGGGYVAELGHNSAAALFILQQLQQNNWVDRLTRAVFFETTIYNANVHVFASLICLFEFPATGAVLPRINVDSFHAYAGVGTKGEITVALMAVFCVVLLLLALQQMLKFKGDTRGYFKDPWNIVEVIFFFMAFVSVGMYGTKEAYTRYITKKISEDKDANIGYMQLSTYEIGYNAIVGLTCFLVTIKTLRILNFSQQVRDLAMSMRLVRKDLLSYAIVFSSIYMAFSMFGMTVFGRHMYDYSSFVRSLESLYSTLLGKFDYRGLYNVSAVFGPIYLIVYALTIVFVLVNLFIGIVTAAFAEARFDMGSVFENEVWSHLLHRIKVLFGLEEPVEPDIPIEEDEDEDKDEEYTGHPVIPEAMQREQRTALQSLDMHLLFLNRYVDTMAQKEDSNKLTQAGPSSSSAAMDRRTPPPHMLDLHTALMWEDIPDSIFEMVVKSPERFTAKSAAKVQLPVSNVSSEEGDKNENDRPESNEPDQEENQAEASEQPEDDKNDAERSKDNDSADIGSSEQNGEKKDAETKQSEGPVDAITAEQAHQEDVSLDDEPKQSAESQNGNTKKDDQKEDLADDNTEQTM